MTTETWLSSLSRNDHGQRMTDTDSGEPKGCIHVTQTVGPPSYSGWTVNPHIDFWATSDGGVGRQFIPLEYGSFALRHTRMQQTNRDNVVQIELVGRCTDETGTLKLATDWRKVTDSTLLAFYKKVILPVSQARGIPIRDNDLFSTGRRLSDIEFDNYSGWLGHINVPQNDHFDPSTGFGAMWDRMLHLASGQKIITPSVGPVAPAFPLSSNEYYGLNTHNGYSGGVDSLNIKKWQTQMQRRGWRIYIDGKFGPESFRILKSFQTEKKLMSDGRLGRVSWRASWTLPIA